MVFVDVGDRATYAETHELLMQVSIYTTRPRPRTPHTHMYPATCDPLHVLDPRTPATYAQDRVTSFVFGHVRACESHDAGGRVDKQLPFLCRLSTKRKRLSALAPNTNALTIFSPALPSTSLYPTLTLYTCFWRVCG
eukprot:3462394-Pleurochrysis_carterae.AAC.1